MSATTSMQARVEQFLVERRQLGFSDDGYVLRSFARHVHATRLRGALTVELMAVWARSECHESDDPRTWARRLKNLSVNYVDVQRHLAKGDDGSGKMV